MVLEDGDRGHHRVEGRPAGGQHGPAGGQRRRHALPPARQAIGVRFAGAGAAVDGQNWFGHAASIGERPRGSVFHKLATSSYMQPGAVPGID
jgi:hypothetical protein